MSLKERIRELGGSPPEVVPEPDRKLQPKEASYTSPGPYPFVCGTCKHLNDEKCDIVEGPYKAGRVHPDDACRFWRPTPSLLSPDLDLRGKSGKVPGEGPDKDTIPALLTPREYVLNDEMVDYLGGEEVLEKIRLSLGKYGEKKKRRKS